MAIKELFQDDRPQLLFDPRSARRIDPRFKFTRNSAASFVDRYGVLQVSGAPAGQPRYNYDPVTKEYLGLLLEPSRTNFFTNSSTPASAWGILSGVVSPLAGYAQLTPGGSTDAVTFIENTATSGHYMEKFLQVTNVTLPHTYSIYVKPIGSPRTIWLTVYGTPFYANGFNFSFNLTTGAVVPTANAGTGSSLSATLLSLPGNWYRLSVTGIPTTFSGSDLRVRIGLINASTVYQGDGVSGVAIWAPQVEAGAGATSYIPTSGASATRAADIISYAGPLPSPGSVFVDSRADSSTNGDVVVSLANPSNNKINLAYESRAATYNSLALVANYSGTVKSSLPLPVPSTARERNIVTWGTNNYQYGSTFSRYAPSLVSSVPSGMTRLSIGHDAVDPTKAFIGHINKLYMWAGEIEPSVAEALVRGELDPINADTYSPVGPAGSLSLIINTQGAGTDAEKTFTLPANRASAYAATALVAGQTYRISVVGTTNWTLIGAAANTVGTIFTATGPGTGTGTAFWHNDIVVTWGDGTESGLEGAGAEVGAVGLTHTYPSAGIYPVWVEGRIQNLYYNNGANAPDLVRIERWGTGNTFQAPTTMNGAFYGCSKMDFGTSARTTNIPNTSAVTDWSNAFRDCASITGVFPQFNYSAATTLAAAFYGCASITQWPDAGNQTASVTNFSEAWRGCSSLVSFPLINTSSATNLNAAFYGCVALTSFPLINTAACTSLTQTWTFCSSLASFPLINTANVTSFNSSWYNCSSLTSFPLLNTAKGTDFGAAWHGCNSLTTFPLINTSLGTSFPRTWLSCGSLTAFPLLSMSNATNVAYAWYNCSSLTAFPAVDLSKVVGSATDSASSDTGFLGSWQGCTSLTTFPANMFNTTTCTRFTYAFSGCALTAASIENIIVSINAAGTSNGNLGLEGGTNAGAATWTANAIAAYDALIARGWTITRNA